MLGRLSQEALNYMHPLARNGRAYFSVAHVVSLNSGCETQLLAPCFGQPTGFTPADHEQRYSVASGVLLDDRRGGWFSVDGEYGSGLSSAMCPPIRPDTASRRRTRPSTSKKASRSHRRPRSRSTSRTS